VSGSTQLSRKRSKTIRIQLFTDSHRFCSQNTRAGHLSQNSVSPVSILIPIGIHKPSQQNYLCRGSLSWHSFCNSQGTSFLSHVGSFPGVVPGRRIAEGTERQTGWFIATMVTRAKMTAALSLLIAIVQFAGVGAVSISGAGPTSAEYYCCCPGECHCTADCCNHAPASADAGADASTRIGPGTPILEAPNRCGVWTGTLNRSPNSPKALPVNEREQAAMRPEHTSRRLPDSAPVISSRATLRASTPRAPPISVEVA
jgi:hypothetical protein